MKEELAIIQNLKINYKIGGEGAPILILHGWDSSSQAWQKAAEVLIIGGFRVIVPDLPGFGKSSFPPQAWSVSDYLELVVDFAEKLKTLGEISEPFFLFGHSFGGRISIKFGAVYPEKISGLILCSPGGLLSKKKIKVKIFYFLAKLGKVFFSPPFLKSLQNFSRKILYRLAGTRDYLRASPIMKETMKKIISENLLSCLPQIKTKTLIIWGGKDRILPISDAYLMKEKIPNSNLETISNVGHALNLECPAELADIIVRWLKKQSKSV